MRPTDAPFLVVRVVTRGLYNDLVYDSVCHNLKALKAANCLSYAIQVVTEQELKLPRSSRVFQVRQSGSLQEPAVGLVV